MWFPVCPSPVFSRFFGLVGVRALAAAAVGTVLFSGSPGTSAAAASPFPSMSGSWSGGGTVTLASGTKERIRCRARYDVGGGGEQVDLTLRCASDSYKFELQSNASHYKGTISGNWTETTRRIGGSLEGTARGNTVLVRVSGTLSAMLGVSTSANRQSISIEAPGTEMARVSISLSRR